MIGAQALHENPYDDHTLGGALKQGDELAGLKLEGEFFMNLGYRGHGYEGPATVHVVGRKLKELPKCLAKWMKRHATIEPAIGRMKSNGRLGRNVLSAKLGAKLNAVMCDCGHNLRLMLNRLGWKERRRFIFVFLSWPWSWLAPPWHSRRDDNIPPRAGSNRVLSGKKLFQERL